MKPETSILYYFISFPLVDIKENNIDKEVVNNKNIIEISLDSLEVYLDLSINISYTSLSKRVFKYISKILLNKK